MRRIRSEKKRILALGALLVMALIGSTFAYFSQELSASNEFLTGKYDTEIHEEFIPPNDWQPGVSIPKKVEIQNTGNVAVVAAAKITEACSRKDNVVMTEYGTENRTLVSKETVVAKAGESLPVTFQTENGQYEDVGIKAFGSAVVEYDSQKDASEYQDKWVHLLTEENEKPVHYFLYVGIIDGGTTTPSILESVTMNPKLESTVTNTKLIADVDDDGNDSYTFTYNTSKYGYDSVNYKLDIQAKTVQATKDAVDAVLGSSKELPTDMVPKEFDSILYYVRNQCSDGNIEAE